MLLIGDVHGLFFDYKAKIRRLGVKTSLQLGDFGLGFPNSFDHFDMSDIKGTHKFIRGNHDNPAICRKDEYYAGDFGTIEGDFVNGLYDKLFFISGAWSIDKAYRVEGKTWWEEEQLSQEELCEAVNKYNEDKPEIVVSHDCPTIVLQNLYPSRLIPTRTSQAMDVMFLTRKPQFWIFAHHHQSWRKNIDGCTFICLDELEVLNLDEMKPFGNI